MKKDIHPKYHPIIVIMTDGETFTTRSSYGKSGEQIKLAVDPKSHTAWTKKRHSLIDRGGRLTRFEKQYGGLAFSSLSPKKDQDKESQQKDK